MKDKPPRKWNDRSKSVSTTDMEDEIKKRAGVPVNAKDVRVWHDSDYTYEYQVNWREPETDEEYAARCAKWDKNADKRKAADEKRKAKKTEERRRKEEQERKELARLQAKYGP